MFIELLLICISFLESHETALEDNLQRCILFKIPNHSRLDGCLYVPKNYPLHKFKPMNIPKKEKSSMAPLFSINKPLYKDWGIMDKPEYIVLAFDNNQVIGGARVIKNKKNDYIEHLYVLNNYRGNKVGSRLLEICTIIAYNRKKKFLQLDAVPDEFTVNSYKRLEQFYLDRGFFLHEGTLIKKTTGTINTDTIEEIKYL